MNKKQRQQIKNRTEAEVKAEYQHWIDTRDKSIEALAKRIKAELNKRGG